MWLQFSRTLAAETSHGPALIALWRHYGWKKAVILGTIDTIWFESGLGLTKRLEAAEIQVLKLSQRRKRAIDASVDGDGAYGHRL